MDKAKIYKYKTLNNVVTRLRDSLKTSDIVLLYAFNRTGKTRLSMAFKDMVRRIRMVPIPYILMPIQKTCLFGTMICRKTKSVILK